MEINTYMTEHEWRKKQGNVLVVLDEDDIDSMLHSGSISDGTVLLDSEIEIEIGYEGTTMGDIYRIPHADDPEKEVYDDIFDAYLELLEYVWSMQRKFTKEGITCQEFTMIEQNHNIDKCEKTYKYYTQPWDEL